jgi:hypothetical protein
MQHYAALFQIFVKAKSEKFTIVYIDKQALAVKQQFENIKHEVRYIIFAL